MAKKRAPDAETITADVQADLARIAVEFDRARGQVLEHWERLRPFEKTFPQAAFENKIPMSLPHRIFGELRDVSNAIMDVAAYVRSTAERTEGEIEQEWGAEQIREARSEAYATIKSLEAILNEPGSDAATALRTGADRLSDLAEKVAPTESKRPYVAPGWSEYHRQVRTWLAAACMTQKAFAGQLGRTPAQVSYAIRGMSRPTERDAILAQITKATGIEPPVALGGGGVASPGELLMGRSQPASSFSFRVVHRGEPPRER